jgi:hypothetical protein
MSIPADMRWTACAPDPLLWIQVREGLLQLLISPAWLLPFLALITYALARHLHGPRPLAGLLAVALPLTVGGLYSPGATLLLEGWLRSQRPALAGGAAGTRSPDRRCHHRPRSLAAPPQACRSCLRLGRSARHCRTTSGVGGRSPAGER